MSIVDHEIDFNGFIWLISVFVNIDLCPAHSHADKHQVFDFLRHLLGDIVMYFIRWLINVNIFFRPEGPKLIRKIFHSHFYTIRNLH